MSSLPGRRLGHYEVLEAVGRGGRGEVFRGRDLHLERDVAIKVLPSGTLADEGARRRFRREALLVSKVNHAHIETVHDFDTQDGVDFLVMEYVVGETLDERLRRGGDGLAADDSTPGAATSRAAAPHPPGPSGCRCACFAILLAVDPFGWRRQVGPPRVAALTVLPLVNRSKNPDEDYFAEGITDELTANLAQIQALRVISRTSASRYKGTTKAVPEIGRELKVRCGDRGCGAASGR